MFKIDEIENLKTKTLSELRGTAIQFVDVRSPSEFKKGAIPESLNVSLFDDRERAKIGTIYRNEGRDAAVQFGQEFVKPKIESLLSKLKSISSEKPLVIHCARGGLRSRAVGWLLRKNDIPCTVLEGGYKSYRRWALSVFERRYSLTILGGLTGTGKTDVLHELSKQGEQVLDLEGLANHRGSSFGRLGMPKQPTPQQFENLIAEKLDRFDRGRRIWVESESKSIGYCYVPHEFFQQMQCADAIHIERSLSERVKYLLDIYGKAKHVELIEAVKRIEKRLGGSRAQTVISMLENGQIEAATIELLDYYDRGYKHFYRKKEIPRVNVTGQNAVTVAKRLIEQLTV